MMADIRGVRVPGHWKTIIYVLLPKKGRPLGIVRERFKLCSASSVGEPIHLQTSFAAYAQSGRSDAR